MEPQRFETVENVIAFARALPDFPNKPLIVEQLETRNVNRFQQAMDKLNEVLVQTPNPQAACTGGGATGEQLQELINRIAQLDASDPVGS
jgi:hypothetical protein